MNKKEQQSIEFLRSMEREESLSLGFSGGKKARIPKIQCKGNYSKRNIKSKGISYETDSRKGVNRIC